MAISKEILINEAHLDPVERTTTDSPARDGRCRFGAYIDDAFVLGTDWREVNNVYDRIYSAF